MAYLPTDALWELSKTNGGGTLAHVEARLRYLGVDR